MSFVHFNFAALLLVAETFVSPFGDFYDKRGNKIGSDGMDDGKKYIVTKRSDVRRIHKITRLRGTVQERSVPSSVVLPSDAAIRESLEVLKRIEARGGLREQSSIVLKDDSVIRGEVGEKARIVGNVQIADCILPALPEGRSYDDVETTIHPHPTAVTVESGNWYPHSASTPSRIDRGTFARFTTNIIVGPLEEIRHIGTYSLYSTPKVPGRQMGIAVYYYNGSKPSVMITERAAERILRK
jgi:hypothetical protein